MAVEICLHPGADVGNFRVPGHERKVQDEDQGSAHEIFHSNLDTVFVHSIMLDRVWVWGMNMNIKHTETSNPGVIILQFGE